MLRPRATARAAVVVAAETKEKGAGAAKEVPKQGSLLHFRSASRKVLSTSGHRWSRTKLTGNSLFSGL
jgi:hypothetical protein